MENESHYSYVKGVHADRIRSCSPCRICLETENSMKTFEYVITDPVGIHARPAGLLVKEVKESGAKVTLACNGKSTDAGKLMSLMAMGIRQGDVVTVTVEGEKEEEAAVRIRQFMECNL